MSLCFNEFLGGVYFRTKGVFLKEFLRKQSKLVKNSHRFVTDLNYLSIYLKFNNMIMFVKSLL